MGTEGDITATRDLKWQRDVNGNTQKIKQFQEVVGGLQDFRTYLLMKPGSAFVTILHSPMKFVAISEATQHLQGRYVGFVGDHTATKDPTPVVLPQQSTWKWETKTTSSDAAALEAHYAADPTRRGKLWAPDQADSDAWTAIMAPRLLAAPLVLFRAIREERRPLMPHEVRGLVMSIVEDADNSDTACDEWQLVLSCCLLAAKQDANGNSYLGVPVDAVTEGDDDYFETWIDQRLDSVFGPRPNIGSAGTTGPRGNTLPQTPTAQVSALMATEVGKGVALGLRAMGHLQRDSSQQGGGYDSEAKGYTKDDIAAVMGFARTYRGSDLPDIWALFNATKGKNIDAYRRHLLARMKQWAYDRRIQIDQSIYLEQETVKAIVELRFNPGEGVAYLASASKGLTILACRACTTAETERVREQEHALSATENTRQLEDLLCLTKGTTRAPADNFWELKMNIATFMSLVWVLFGSECDYYKNLRQIYKTLELKEVYALKAKFTP